MKIGERKVESVSAHKYCPIDQPWKHRKQNSCMWFLFLIQSNIIEGMCFEQNVACIFDKRNCRYGQKCRLNYFQYMDCRLNYFQYMDCITYEKITVNLRI